jgi:hypothetical protein
MIEQFIITVLVIYGVKASTDDGMILHGFYKRFALVLSKLMPWYKSIRFVLKPLFDCTPCMASVYGTLSFFLFGEFPEPTYLSLVIWVFSISGFNYLLNRIINR